jgi:hypothetical protein
MQVLSSPNQNSCADFTTLRIGIPQNYKSGAAQRITEAGPSPEKSYRNVGVIGFPVSYISVSQDLAAVAALTFNRCGVNPVSQSISREGLQGLTYPVN